MSCPKIVRHIDFASFWIGAFEVWKYTYRLFFFFLIDIDVMMWLTARHVTREVAGWLSEFISYHIGCDDFGHFVRSILVDGVTATGQHLQLKFSLHLSHGERSIQSIDAGQQQQFRHTKIEKLLTEILEPAGPIFLRFR